MDNRAFCKEPTWPLQKVNSLGKEVCVCMHQCYSRLKETEDIIQLTLEQYEAPIPVQLKIHV